MKKALFLSLFVIYSILGFSKNSLEEKLLEVYSSSQVESILSESQQKKYFTNLIFNSYKIAEIKDAKFNKSNYPSMSSFELINLDGSLTIITSEELVKSINDGSFNILRLKLEREKSTTKIIVLENTNYIFRLNSTNTLSKLPKQ